MVGVAVAYIHIYNYMPTSQTTGRSLPKMKLNKGIRFFFVFWTAQLYKKYLSALVLMFIPQKSSPNYGLNKGTRTARFGPQKVH